MKTYLATFLFSFLVSVAAKADGLSLQQARDLAASWLGTEEVQAVRVRDAYSIFQRAEGEGYVILLMTETNRSPVIGYAPTSRWEEGNMPPVLTAWLDGLSAIPSAIPSAAAGRRAAPAKRAAAAVQKEDVEPLLTCHWHQTAPYNDCSPVITDGDVKTVAGCVAIASSQITYYWRRDNPPATLRDTPTYIYGGAPVEKSIPKGTPNHWELMRDQYTASNTAEERAAAAQLCYVLGTTAYLNYASSTSGSIKDAANAMYSQFRLLSTYTPKSKYSTQEEWEQALYENLAKGYPVMCSGYHTDGHAFVLDGYSSATDLYHFNFGWGGSGDGYYPVDDTPQAMGGYYQNQAVVIDIRPQTRNIQATMELTATDAMGADVAVKIANHSTLPVRRLLLFVSAEAETPADVAQAVWNGGAVENDGEEHVLTAPIDLRDQSGSIQLSLTDENLYVIASTTIDVAAGIATPVAEEEPSLAIYDLQGRAIQRPSHSGLYLVKTRQGFRKIYIR